MAAFDNLAAASCSRQRSLKQELLRDDMCAPIGLKKSEESRETPLEDGKKALQGAGALPDLVRIVVKLASLFHGCSRISGLLELTVHHVSGVKYSLERVLQYKQ